jgi:hypothetical protein
MEAAVSELGPEAREILRNGRDGDDPLPADRVRIHSALMAAIAAGAATTIASQASAAGTNTAIPASVGAAKPIATSVFGSVFGKGLLIVFFGAAGIGAFFDWPLTNSSRVPGELQRQANPAASMMDAVPQPPPAALPEPSLDKPVESPVIASAMVPPAKPIVIHGASSVAAPKAHEETADSLIAETQRLREAHGALRGGDPEKALALLSDDAAEGEGQKLREERAAARVLVLCKLGRVDEAHAEAASFLAQNPHSPLADRVRNACPNGR